MQMIDFETRGIPFGRPAEVNLRNNHAQYIFTWYTPPRQLRIPSNRNANPRHRYGLAVATSIMLYMVIKKPSSEVARRVSRASRNA